MIYGLSNMLLQLSVPGRKVCGKVILKSDLHRGY